MSLFSIIERPQVSEDVILNPGLLRAADQFYQGLACKKAVKQMQDLMCRELYQAKFLIPSESEKEPAYPMITNRKGGKFYPVFTDLVEFGKFNKNRNLHAAVLRFRDFKKLIRKVDGIVINPVGFNLLLDQEKLERIDQENSSLKIVK